MLQDSALRSDIDFHESIQSMDDMLTVHASALTPEIFSRTIKEHGVILIRSLFPASEAADLIRELEDLSLVIANLEHNGLLSEAGANYVKQGHPADLMPNIRLLQNALNKHVFVHCLQEYFGEEEMVVYSEPTSLRYCDPLRWRNYIPWHQDIFDRGEDFLTIWAPLMRVGEDSPNLEFAPYKLNKHIDESETENVAEEILRRMHAKTDDDGPYSEVGITSKLVDEQVGRQRFAPIMDVGDILVFDPYTVHRTCFRPGMTQARMSLDIRLNPKSRNQHEKLWKTELMNFPAKETVQKISGKSLFKLDHLLLPDFEALAKAVEYTRKIGKADPAARPSFFSRAKNKAKRMLA